MEEDLLFTASSTPTKTDNLTWHNILFPSANRTRGSSLSSEIREHDSGNFSFINDSSSTKSNSNEKLKWNKTDDADKSNSSLIEKLKDTSFKLECKEDANQVLKDTIVEQYCDIQKLFDRNRQLEKEISSLQNQMVKLRSSEKWYRDELHVCQIGNAKVLQEQISIRNIEHDKAVDKLKKENQDLQDNVDGHEFLLSSMKILMEKLEANEKMQTIHIETLKLEKENLKEANEKLQIQLNQQNCEKRALDVSVQKLMDKFKVLSISHSELLRERIANHRMNEELIANLQRIESKNLDLQLNSENQKSSYKSFGDEMQRLKILIKVNENEHKEKLKRYEITNRVLLREANKHLKEKSLQESKMKCLQERINCLQEKHDTLQADALRLSCLLDDHSMLINNDLVKSINNVLGEIHAKKIENTLLNMKVRQIGDKLTNAERVNFENRSKIEHSDNEIKKLKCESEAKTLEIADCKNAIETLRWDTLNAKQKMETELKEDIRNLKKELQNKSLELEITSNRLKMFEESEKVLMESKQRFFDEIQVLKDEIVLMQEEKLALQELVKELRGNLCNIMENQIHHLHHHASCSNLDVAKVKALLEDNAKRSQSLKPLEECVNSLKSEMTNLRSAIRQNTQHRYNVSLMEELNNASSRPEI